MKFKLDIKFPTFNDYDRACKSHWSKGGDMKKQFMEMVQWQLPKIQIEFAPCRLKYIYYEKTEKRDPSNIHSFAEKCILDAMVRKGILKDDNSEYHNGSSYEVKQSHEWAVEVEILEV